MLMCPILTPIWLCTGHLLRNQKVGQACIYKLGCSACSFCSTLWADHVTFLCLMIQSAACNTDIKYVFYFQHSGKRLLMNSFGRSHRQGQWCSTTLMWHKETYMSNSWKGPKPTCATMLWTGSLGRRILATRLPISGKQQQVHKWAIWWR